MNKDFLLSAGVVFLEAKVEATKSKPHLLQNQADWFYISTHGSHDTGAIVFVKPNTGSVTPADIGNKWKDDLEKVFVAGCSVLDINDYNNNFGGKAHIASPGKAWAQTGPTLFFGYNATAPLDNNVGEPDFTAKIVTKYFLKRSQGIPEPKAWAEANRDIATNPNRKTTGGRPFNCSIIDLTVTPARYWFWDFNNLDRNGVPTLTSVPSTNW